MFRIQDFKSLENRSDNKSDLMKICLIGSLMRDACAYTKHQNHGSSETC